MHARVTTLHAAPDTVDAGIENFRANVVPFAREQGKGAILLVDRQSGEAIAITLWEDEEKMRASEEAANTVRAATAQEMGASDAPAVARYEVAAFEV
jgi:formylmethanofuran dehydrogenase subunit E